MNRQWKRSFVNLIGKKIEVISHSNETLRGTSGIVLFESENLIELKRNDGKIVKIPKNNATLKVFFNGEKDYRIFSYREIKGNIIRRLSRL